MIANKFGMSYCDHDQEDVVEFMAGSIPDQKPVVGRAYPQVECSTVTLNQADRQELLDAIRTLHEALRDAWLVFDALGQHAPDEERLAYLHGHEFSSAAFRVRSSMLSTNRLAVKLGLAK